MAIPVTPVTPLTTITVTLDPEIKELIERLTKELHEFNANQKPVILGCGTLDTLTGEVIPDPIPSDNCPYPDDTKVSLNPQHSTADDAASTPAHTREQLQQLVVKVSAAGMKDAVKKIVNKYSPKVSAVPEDKIDQVYAEVEALI